MAARAIRASDLGLTARAGRDPALSGLTADSRAVRAGMLFAALPGTATHGARFIATPEMTNLLDIRPGMARL